MGRTQARSAASVSGDDNPRPVAPPPVVSGLRLAASDPTRPAVIDGVTGEGFSRAELAERSAALAAGLAERGIGRGDRAAVALPNLAWWPVVALGVWRAGAVLVPLSTFWTADEAGRVLARVRPRVAIASEPLAPVLRGALSAAGLAAEIVAHGTAETATPLERLLVSGEDPFAEPEVGPGDVAVILFSSGTGGLPKGVRWRHANLAAESTHASAGFGIDADSVALACAPFFHALGLFQSFLGPLSVGAQIVTLATPETEQILGLIAGHRVTHAVLRPPTVAEIAAAADAERHDTSSLELVVTGGAHVPPAVQLRAGERLGCLVRQGYGMTEAGLISGPLGGPSDPSTVGWLAPDTEARLVEPDSGRDAPPGQPGELWVRGPQVTDGYYGDPDATAATVTPDGWLRTGDLATIRDDGQLVIKDRLKELIKVGGRSVAPAELELVLREHPSVRDAAVVGRPHPDHGEVPVAYVALEVPVGYVALMGPPTPDELISFVGSRIAAYKHLHGVRIVDELPRLPSGKLLRRTLRDRERAAAARTSGGRTDA
jgi:acyl-CoA synthetase (AMP-forming)/AMP-acid ligase II